MKASVAVGITGVWLGQCNLMPGRGAVCSVLTMIRCLYNLGAVIRGVFGDAVEILRKYLTLNMKRIT
jgi:hypothetical protein